MEEFEKKLKKAQKGKSKIGVLFLVLSILLIVIGISQTGTDKDSWAIFDGTNSGEYYKAEILYLVGPFAEYTEGNSVTSQVYTALTKDNEYILVHTKTNTELPVLGEDITEENIDSELEPITIYGYAELLESDVEQYLVDFWNEVYEEELFTTENYLQYFGYCYLDTMNQVDSTSTTCYIFAIIFGVIAVLSIFGNKKEKQNISNILKELEESGKLEEVKNEYANYTVEKYEKINLEITENYIISYKPQLAIIERKDIVNAYRTNMIDGVYQLCKYIAVETKNNEKYYLAQVALEYKKPEFNDALEKIKSKIVQGGN